ncbi:hypothetical protein ATK74_0833 [Propionicimonas paludicola]|uniref:Helix-turn-helix DNA binding domain protein n=1 Tax=Propionicimonas paludicola TaxID=185243 RepID=A0A2A9CRX7_9ACTN|nr:hypothetical protein [Propionicimonas paludicola]PFG16299.1 hypothetical protein ATK74_0833 [Propionicimonas paludicola]
MSAETPRTYADPVDCQHGGRHQHGTRSAYVFDRCRCEACTIVNREGMRIRSRQKALARWNPELDPFIPGDVVRAHLRGLMDAGMGWKRIAAAAGVATSTVYPILYGKNVDQPDHPEYRPPRKQVRRNVAEKLLAVTLDLADGAMVDGTGTRRRLQALVTVGWSQSRLASELGWTVANFGHLIHGTGLVTKGTAARVRDLYDRCWSAPPTATTRQERGGITRARKVARQHGWMPPMAWDDDTIDDPAARPNVGVPAVTTNARIEDVRELLELGEHPDMIAARIGMKASSLHELLRRNAPELATEFGTLAHRRRTEGSTAA